MKLNKKVGQVWFNTVTGNEFKIKKIFSDGIIRLSYPVASDGSKMHFDTSEPLMHMYVYSGEKFTNYNEKVKVFSEQEGIISVPEKFAELFEVIPN